MARTMRAARGVTLIELMVAMAIGLLLIAGALSVYVQSRKHYSVNEAVAQLQNSARYALEILEPDLRLANYYGLTSQVNFIAGRAGPLEVVPAGLAVGSDCGVNWAINLSVPIEAQNNSYTLGCAAYGSGAAPGSDLLVVRHASVNLAPPQNGTVQLQSSPLQGRLFADGVLVGALGATSQTNDLVTHGYYIAQDTVGQPGRPSLRRKWLAGGAGGPQVLDEEIAPGVQDLQVQLGIDTNFDDAVNQYLNPDAVPAGARVMAVRIWLLVRAENPEQGFVDDRAYIYADRNLGPFNDNFRRMLISRTIQMRNMREVT